jgi:hypothetical protein
MGQYEATGIYELVDLIRFLRSRNTTTRPVVLV